MFSHTVEDGYEKAWCAYVAENDGLQETLSHIKTVCEEAVLAHKTVLIEILVPKATQLHLPFHVAEASLEL